MANSETIKRHPDLVRILNGLLDGESLDAIAKRFRVPRGDLQSYGQEAGLFKVRTEEERRAAHEREVLEEQARRRGDSQGPRPEENDSYAERERELRQQEQEQRELVRNSYLQQAPRRVGSCMAGDPLIPSFEFRPGFQPHERLVALNLREQRRRAERLEEWRSSPWHWNEEPPADWFS